MTPLGGHTTRALSVTVGGGGGKQKRAVMGPFRAGLSGGNGAKHLNLDNSPAEQLAPAPLANSARLDICSHVRQRPLLKVDASSWGGAWLENGRGRAVRRQKAPGCGVTFARRAGLREGDRCPMPFIVDLSGFVRPVCQK